MAPEDAKIGNNTLDALLTIATAIFALNWALVEFAETDLLLDVLELSGQSLTLAYAAAGATAVVTVYNTAVWMGWTGYMEG